MVERLEVEAREIRPDEIDEMLALRNRIFPHLSREGWEKQEGTCAVALIDGKIVGAIPLAYRDFLIRPDVVLRAAFEHAVGVREDLRDRGIGSAMLNAAKEFLKGKVDVLMVYRGAETSIGYNFYAKNLHYDMTYIVPWSLPEPALASHGGGDCRVTDIDEFLNREEEVLEVFQSAYGGTAGFPRRRSGYYREILFGMIYEVLPCEFFCIVHPSNGRLDGYLLVGKRTVRDSVSWQALEIATLNGSHDIAVQLMNKFKVLVSKDPAPVSFRKQSTSIYAPALRETGFVQTPRARTSMMVMAYPLDAESMARKAWRFNERLSDVEIKAWSPRREVTLFSPAGKVSRNITLEMKDDTLTRLLLSRLDLEAAVRQELVTAIGATPDDIREIAKSLPFTPWEYHQTDYL